MTALGAKSITWTEAEDATIVRLYPTLTSMGEIRAQLQPGRSVQAITYRASVVLKVQRPKHRPHPGKVVSVVILRDGVPGKACVVCLDWKPLEKFSKHATCAGGRRNRCTTCEGRTAYRDNRATRIAAVRRYQKANPKKYREHKRAGWHARRARLMAVPSNVTTADIRGLIALYGGVCAYCRVKPADSIDHVIPLARGGTHELSNLLPACLPCNMEKHAMTLEQWQTKKGIRL